MDWSTLGTDCVDNCGIWVFGGVIYLVCCVLLLMYRGTLDLAGASVVVLGSVVLTVLCCNTLSVNWISCQISSPPLLLPKFLLLWRSLILRPLLCKHVWWWVGWAFCDWNGWCMWNVRCWWILCGIYVCDSFLVMSTSTVPKQCGKPMCLFCLSSNVPVLRCPLAPVAFFNS